MCQKIAGNLLVISDSKWELLDIQYNKKHMKCFRRTEECIEFFELYGLKACIFVLNIIILGSKLMTKWCKYENIYAL
jgi:hypothetical protein